MEDNKKTELFERVPVPDAVMRLAVGGHLCCGGIGRMI